MPENRSFFADVKNRRFNFDNFAPGLYAFALGLFKKVIVADTFGVAVEAGFADALSLKMPGLLLAGCDRFHLLPPFCPVGSAIERPPAGAGGLHLD